MNKLILAITFFLVMPFQALASEGNRAVIVSAETIKKMLDDGAEFTILDSRREKDYWKEHIVGAISLPAIDTNAQSLSEVVRDPESKIIFYCQNVKCQASKIAASKALGAGYKYVYEFSGGIDAWKANGYPTKELKVQPAE